MKKILVVLLALSSPILAAPSPSQADPKASFQEIGVFSLGATGFAGHVSPEEKIYREILATPGAQTRFVETLQSRHATVEAKLYAMCGLREIAPASFNQHRRDFQPSVKASTLKGDILNKEVVADILYRIDRFGCN
ncbi:MchS3 family protein [Burkholderia paludis]|uniref:MchS3 family protein n=1 Tax=Burkholderia paludis TaxID=1506587 RepID=UPI000ABDC2CD|nr:MchS3 family protein [Burkholderia paludis]